MTVVVVLLSVVCIYLSINKLLVNRELRRITKEIKHLGLDSNCQLTVELNNPAVIDLAVAVNNLQERHQETVVEYVKREGEYKQSMADISHDLRTPLTALSGYLKLLKKEEGIAPKNKEYLDIAYEKAGALKRLVTSLFELARLECNAYHFEWSSVNLKEVLEQQLASFYPEFLQRRLEPKVAIADTAMEIRADDTAVQRIISNLLQNALQHGCGNICLNAFVKEERVVVEISNSAPHLNVEEVAQLFARSYTVDPVRTHSGGGLGLAIVKAFTEQMGGRAEGELKAGRLYITVSFRLNNILK